jgi:hypothetical protein
MANREKVHSASLKKPREFDPNTIELRVIGPKVLEPISGVLRVLGMYKNGHPLTQIVLRSLVNIEFSLHPHSFLLQRSHHNIDGLFGAFGHQFDLIASKLHLLELSVHTRFLAGHLDGRILCVQQQLLKGIWFAQPPQTLLEGIETLVGKTAEGLRNWRGVRLAVVFTNVGVLLSFESLGNR